MTKIRAISLLGVLILSVVFAGCTTVASISNLRETVCGNSFETQLSSILAEQGEKPAVATSLAHQSTVTLSTSEYGPRPFLVASPSGTDYTLFVQKKPDRCLLRLYGRHKGFVSYTNNLTYISTRELDGCGCKE